MLFHALGRIALLSVLLAPAMGQAELELVDGRVLAGVEVRREGEVYLLTLEDGSTVTLPVELVESVRLILAGDDVKPATASEQLEVLGEPARFQKSIVDPSWTPTTDWDMDPERQNNFAPSTWSESPIDPEWKPESDWDPNEDVLKSSRSTFQKPILDQSWTPTDGFANSVGRR